MIILLDSGPLGMVSNPNATNEALACQNWLIGLIAAQVDVRIPEIIDYEVRRELLRAKKQKGLQRLDSVKQALAVEPITGVVLLKAAELWAIARQSGKPTANDKALDVDVILAAHAHLLASRDPLVLVVTTNIKHFSALATAKLWPDVPIPQP